MKRARVGELESIDFGGRTCVLTYLGPDANAIFDAIEPLLREAPLLKKRGSRRVKIYDSADPASRKVTVRYS